MKPKAVRTHLFEQDLDVPPATDPRRPNLPGVPYCRCGVRKDHPRHTLPEVEQDVRGLAAGEREDA